MNQIKLTILAFLLGLASLVVTAPASAEVSVFTEHTVMTLFDHRVANEYAPTGDVPYIGKLGLKYRTKYFTLGGGYIHRSNVDITGDNPEYWYNGGFISGELHYCFAYCR